MALDGLKCFLWIALLRISHQHREKGSDVNFSMMTDNSMTSNVSYSVKPSPNNCACHNQDDKIYNLAPLQNTDETPRFAKDSVLTVQKVAEKVFSFSLSSIIVRHIPKTKKIYLHMAWIAILMFPYATVILTVNCKTDKSSY